MRYIKANAAALLILAVAACGNPDTPGGRAADARHENFEDLGEAFKTIDDEFKKASPDLAAVATAAGKVEAASQQLENWFPAGSSKGDGMRTDALQAVWDKPAEFKQAAANFKLEAARFDALAAAGDAGVMRAGLRGLGGACKQCHDKFRKPE